jgi:thiol-disulfide isomerase/thioredoxin
LFFRVEEIEHEAYKNALSAAAGSDRLVLLDFTGSDWCGGCIVLEEETLRQPAFRKYARENLELVVVDFPREKPLRPEVQQQNYLMQQKFGITGYPTLVLVNARGREVARRSGITINGPKEMIDWVESVR